MVEKKYIINIDFTTKSKIHFNSKLHDTDTRCKERKKNRKYGGWVSYTKDEVQKFVDKSEKLFFDSKEVTNLTRCDLCAKFDDYDFDSLFDLDKHSVAKSMYKLEYRIDHEKIKLFLNDIKYDVQQIVKKLHWFTDDEILQKSFSYNLWVFNNSINKGKQKITNKMYQQGLMDHGFYSPELERKLDLYYNARKYEFPQQKSTEIKYNKNENWFQKLWNSVKKHLGIIDVILGSLASVIPVLGAATEYKETVEHTVNYAFS